MLTELSRCTNCDEKRLDIFAVSMYRRQKKTGRSARRKITSATSGGVKGGRKGDGISFVWGKLKDRPNNDSLF